MRSKRIDTKVVKYLMDKLNNLYIEVLGKYEGSLFELMPVGKLEGWCWQTTESAIVFFNDDDYIERGNLKFDERTSEYYHSWVCFNFNGTEYVLDPCLSFLCQKSDYSKIFEIDEKGNVSLIGKENSEYDFEEILLKENDLENLNLELKSSKDALSNIKQRILHGNLASIGIICCMVGIYAFLRLAIPVSSLIKILAIFYIFTKVPASLMYGTRIGNRKKKKELIADIEKMKLDVLFLQNELDEIKEESKYRVDSSNVVESNENDCTLNVVSDLSYSSSKQNDLVVLKLSRKKQK